MTRREHILSHPPGPRYGMTVKVPELVMTILPGYRSAWNGCGYVGIGVDREGGRRPAAEADARGFGPIR